MRIGKKRLQSGLEGAHLARSGAAHLLGEFSELLREIGSPPEPGALPEFFGVRVVESISDLVQLTESYYAQVLTPLELPAVADAWRYAERGETRELIEHDRQLSSRLLSTPFAEASRRIGRLQLSRMRPMRGERTTRRYLAAVETGEAAGWHPIVFGLTLAVYSLPLRQGLLFYGSQILLGLADAAASARNFADEEVEHALRPVVDRLPATIEAVVSPAAEFCRD